MMDVRIEMFAIRGGRAAEAHHLFSDAAGRCFICVVPWDA